MPKSVKCSYNSCAISTGGIDIFVVPLESGYHNIVNAPKSLSGYGACTDLLPISWKQEINDQVLLVKLRS